MASPGNMNTTNTSAGIANHDAGGNDNNNNNNNNNGNSPRRQLQTQSQPGIPSSVSISASISPSAAQSAMPSSTTIITTTTTTSSTPLPSPPPSNTFLPIWSSLRRHRNRNRSRNNTSNAENDNNNDNDNEINNDNNNNNNHNNHDDEEEDDEANVENWFTPLTTVQTLKRTMKLYLQSGTVRLFVKLALLFVIPATAILLTILYTVLKHNDPNNNNNNNNDDENTWSWFRYFTNYVTLLMSQSLIRTTLGAVSDGAMAVAVADLYLKRTPHWLSCLQKASSKVTTLVLAGLVGGIGTLIGYWCLYLPGLYIKVHLLVVTPVIILEDEISPLSALGRSWDLVQQDNYHVFQCLLGLDGLYVVCNWFLRALLKNNPLIADGNNHPFFSWTFHILQTIPATMITPLFGILKTVIYIHLMVKQEGMTMERLANQVDEGFLASTRVRLLDDVQPIHHNNNNNNQNNHNSYYNNNYNNYNNNNNNTYDVENDDLDAVTTTAAIFQDANDDFISDFRNNNHNNPFWQGMMMTRSSSSSSHHHNNNTDVSSSDGAMNSSIDSRMSAFE